MYSKERGYTTEPPALRRLSYRQPERPRMQVPFNYSGHAIVDGEERPLGRVEETEDPAEPILAEGPIPRFDDLPRVSELGESRRRPPPLTIPIPMGESEESETADRPSDDGPSEEGAPADEGRNLSPTPPPSPPAPEEPTKRSAVFDLSRFPFGHGIGWEELLIMGLIWLLLHENAACGRERGDLDETVILLGLLLLLG